MDVTEAIKTRRSVRKYKSTPVDEGRIMDCLEAARWAPSADNLQPWGFIVIRNPETRRRLAEIHDWGKFMAESPVVIAFLADPRRSPRHFHGDAAVAVQNFMLTAHSLGLGTCWMGVIASEFERPIKRLLGVPEDMVVLCTVSVGYPDERPTGSRRPLQEMVHREKYGAMKR